MKIIGYYVLQITRELNLIYIKHLFACNHIHLEKVKVEDAVLNIKC